MSDSLLQDLAREVLSHITRSGIASMRQKMRDSGINPDNFDLTVIAIPIPKFDALDCATITVNAKKGLDVISGATVTGIIVSDAQLEEVSALERKIATAHHCLADAVSMLNEIESDLSAKPPESEMQ